MTPGDGVPALRATFAAVARTTLSGYDEIVNALEDVEPCDVVLDEIDVADTPALEELVAFVHDVPAHVAIIAIARSRETIADGRLFTGGLAALCDEEKLTFTPAEIAQLAEALGVSYSGSDITRLLDASEGWAVVVSGAIREAASTNTSLGGAHERWRRTGARSFAGFIEAELSRADACDRDAVRRLMSGATLDDPATLQRLAARGLFVRETAEGFEPSRALAITRGGRAPRIDRAVNALAPMTLRLFGRFEARIGERNVAWMRRRDQQIVQYLALREGGRATRTELQERFWPNVDRSAAAQNLRTACSTIRRALAALVGYADVEQYFRVKYEVALNTDLVISDVSRFEAHLRDGASAYDEQSYNRTIDEYTAAERLYAPLLCGEVADAHIALRARELAAAHQLALERLAETLFKRGDYALAGRYARRVVDMRAPNASMTPLLGSIEHPATRPSAVAANEEDVATIAIELFPSVIVGERRREVRGSLRDDRVDTTAG